MRAIWRSVAAVAGAAAVVAGALVAGPVQPAAAADIRNFNPGNIISDAMMYNSATMTEAQVQAFLTAKVPTCRVGYTCLKDYRQDSYTIAGTPMCSTYQGAPGETAARMIVKVAQACGINPQVLLVMLQKEQGLVADSWPTARQYRSAMGAGCPDTAACDTNYYGFFNQLHYGAYLLKRYTQPKGTGAGTSWSSRYDLMYPVGKTSPILYQANRPECGTKDVFVQNQATHSLYVYTPYTPNAAALNAGYGTGDGCSAYGNRNFFLYFSDWFGSTQLEVGAEVRPAYDRAGGQNGYLGWATGRMVCGLLAGGCYQAFQGGQIHWTPATGAHATDGAILGAWTRAGMEAGALGYPSGDVICGLTRGGCYQAFVGGLIHWSAASGAHPTDGAVQAKWRDLGWEGGSMGYPAADPTCSTKNPGCSQRFQGGTITWSAPTGAQTVDGDIEALWQASGRGDGSLGYPKEAPTCGLRGGGCVQDFQSGAIVWTPGTKAVAVDGAIHALWRSQGEESGPLGYPTA
ncbi:MAG TPA: hypothetical protein VIL55_12070, partial [Naasia sp.]